MFGGMECVHRVWSRCVPILLELVKDKPPTLAWAVPYFDDIDATRAAHADDAAAAADDDGDDGAAAADDAARPAPQSSPETWTKFNSRQRTQALKFATMKPKLDLVAATTVSIPAINLVLRFLPVGGKSWTAKKLHEALEAGEQLPTTPMADAYDGKSERSFIEECSAITSGTAAGLRCLALEDSTQGMLGSLIVAVDKRTYFQLLLLDGAETASPVANALQYQVQSLYYHSRSGELVETMICGVRSSIASVHQELET